MLRSASIRSLARAARTPAQRRFASSGHEMAYDRSTYQGQSANGVKMASLALGSLFAGAGALSYFLGRNEIPGQSRGLTLAGASVWPGGRSRLLSDLRAGRGGPGSSISPARADAGLPFADAPPVAPITSASPSSLFSDAGEPSTAIPSSSDPSAAAASGAEPGEGSGDGEAQGQQAAFNPETGEINWACPCLGGMADGPCGPEFKEAFACFVYSNDEPKGVECVPKFRNMQDCFRKHPDIYGNGESTTC